MLTLGSIHMFTLPSHYSLLGVTYSRFSISTGRVAYEGAPLEDQCRHMREKSVKCYVAVIKKNYLKVYPTVMLQARVNGVEDFQGTYMHCRSKGVLQKLIYANE